MNTDFFTFLPGGLQSQVHGLLRLHPWFGDITIHKQQEAWLKDLVNEATRGLILREGESGVTLVVGVPYVRRDQSQSNAGAKPLTVLEITVVENEVTNQGPTGTHKPCAAVALKVYEALKGQIFNGLGLGFAINSGANPLMPMEDDDSGNKQWKVTLESLANIDFDPKVMMPTITVAGNEVTLACATPGAQIYYSTDGSFPCPAPDGTGTSYGAPFTPEASCKVLAVAVLEDMRPSDQAALLVPINPVSPTGDTDGNQVVDTDGNVVVNAG